MFFSIDTSFSIKRTELSYAISKYCEHYSQEICFSRFMVTLNNIRNSQRIKQEHELAVCTRFLLLYNALKRSNVFLIREGNPVNNEPDCICSDNIGIELVGIYDNEYQAKKKWNLARGKELKIKPQHLLLTSKNLEKEIAKKLQKLNENKYSGFLGKIILVCNLHSPLLQDKDVAKFINEYICFSNDNFFERYFYQIWIMWQSDIDYQFKISMLDGTPNSV